MILPRQAIGVYRESSWTKSTEGISSQSHCKIGDIYGTRSTQRCTGPSWARVCVDVPEFKQGACESDGANCEECFANCKNQFTSAGGWSIRNTGSIDCH